MIEKVKWRKGGKLTRAAADHVFVHFFIFHWTRDAMIFDSRLMKDSETKETHLYTRCINLRLCSCFATLPRIGPIENESRTTLFAVPSRHLDISCTGNFSLLLSGSLDPSSLLDQ